MKAETKNNAQQNTTFLIDMIDAEQAVEGYRRALDRTKAFELMVDDLLDQQKLSVLTEVMEEHRKQFPQDPLLSISAGEIAKAKSDWMKADQAYAAVWKNATMAQRQRWSYSRLFVRCKAGQALQAYRESMAKAQDFRMLADMVLADKQIELFAQLVEAHRPQRPNDPEFDAFDARLQILRGKPGDAAVLFKRCWENLPDADRPVVHDEFINSLANAGKGSKLEAYACAPDKMTAFHQLVWRYRKPKNVRELERLIEEHTKHHPTDRRLLIERAELHLLRGDALQAEQGFLIAKDKGTAFDAGSARMGLLRARIRLGRVVPTFHELGRPTRQPSVIWPISAHSRRTLLSWRNCSPLTAKRFPMKRIFKRGTWSCAGSKKITKASST